MKTKLHQFMNENVHTVATPPGPSYFSMLCTEKAWYVKSYTWFQGKVEPTLMSMSLRATTCSVGSSA